MKYHTVIPARFLSRPNRFIAKVELDGREETVHVKNTGRCKELLIPGNTVYLALGENPKRKTKYDLIAVEKRPGLLINMDSQLPNAAAAQWLPKSGLFSEKAVIRREVTYGASRFDLYVEDGLRRAFLEVKGVTLEEEGLASFPDAPTERGAKHLRGLTELARNGFGAYVLFVIQMADVEYLHPNDATDPNFGTALREAAAAGVQVLAMDCDVTVDSMTVRRPVPVRL